VKEGRRIAERPYDPPALLGVLVLKVLMLGLPREWEEIEESLSKTWKGDATIQRPNNVFMMLSRV
jgi:hypothetical protein